MARAARRLLALALALAVGGAALACASGSPPTEVAPGEADPEPYALCGIRSFAWTERGVVARGEQPSAESLTCLREQGFGALVSLRLEGSGYDEKAAVEALGMDYLSLPMEDDTAPCPEQVSQYLAFVDSHRRAGQPVYEHCAGGRGRAGTLEGIYLLWKGWSTADVLARYVRFGAKVDCENGGNGQVQALHEIGLLLGRGDAWPDGKDSAGAVWPSCPRPAYMAGWDYSTSDFPTEMPSAAPAVYRAFLPLVGAGEMWLTTGARAASASLPVEPGDVLQSQASMGVAER